MCRENSKLKSVHSFVHDFTSNDVFTCRKIYRRDKPQFSFFLIIFCCLRPWYQHVQSIIGAWTVCVLFIFCLIFWLLKAAWVHDTIADTGPGPRAAALQQLNPTKVVKWEKGRRLNPTPRAASWDMSLTRLSKHQTTSLRMQPDMSSLFCVDGAMCLEMAALCRKKLF